MGFASFFCANQDVVQTNRQPRQAGGSAGDRQFHRLQSFEEKCSAVALRCSRRSRLGQGWRPRFHWVENSKTSERGVFQNHNQSKAHVIAGIGRVSAYARSRPPAGPDRLITWGRGVSNFCSGAAYMRKGGQAFQAGEFRLYQRTSN